MKTLLLFIVFLAAILCPQEKETPQEKAAPSPNANAAGETIESPKSQLQSPQSKTDARSAMPGIVKDKPAKGRFVKVKDGYMVPYTQTIPGSNVKFEMVPIPGGTFTMGSPDDERDRSDDEGPQIEVTIEPFWMAKHETTWAQYKMFMRLCTIFTKFEQRGLRKIENDHQVDAITAPSPLYRPSFTYEAGQGPKQPAASMTQFAAKQYTKWLSLLDGNFYRLPYEAEWEYACRAGSTTAFYFGDKKADLKEHAWFSGEKRHDVGQLKPNAWGLHDMYGNVAEWVLDKYTEEGYEHVADKKNLTAASVYVKPDEPYPLVMRGGTWEMEPEYCRSASRFATEDDDWKTEDPNSPTSPWWFTDSPGLGSGFRIIRPLNVPKTRTEKETFWAAGLEIIDENARDRIESNGRGSYGYVDPKLPEAIKSLEGNR